MENDAPFLLSPHDAQASGHGKADSSSLCINDSVYFQFLLSVV
jgi:hypothetical protein